MKTILKLKQRIKFNKWVKENPNADVSEIELAKHYILNKF